MGPLVEFAPDPGHFALKPVARDGHGLCFIAHLYELEKRPVVPLCKNNGYPFLWTFIALHQNR